MERTQHDEIVSNESKYWIQLSTPIFHSTRGKIRQCCHWHLFHLFIIPIIEEFIIFGQYFLANIKTVLGLIICIWSRANIEIARLIFTTLELWHNECNQICGHFRCFSEDLSVSATEMDWNSWETFSETGISIKFTLRMFDGSLPEVCC